MARELDDAILSTAHQRARHRHLAAQDRRRRAAGARARRDAARAREPLARARDASACCAARLARLDVSSRTLFALIEPGSCFAGTLARAGVRRRPHLHAGAARRRSAGAEARRCRRVELRPLSDGQRPDAPAAPLLRAKPRRSTPCARRSGKPLDADAALALGLVTAAPDDIDWDDEIRIAIEERARCRPTR